jgi:dihydroorotase
MGFDDVLARVTVAPARHLGLDAEGYGRLEPGGPAHVSVLRALEGPEELPDAAGGSRLVRRLEPRLVLLGGEVVESIPWRGAVPALP